MAAAQGIPVKFLESILAELKRAGIVASQRGADGGYWLARPAAEVTVADIIRAVEGPLADVRGVRPESLDYPDDLEALQRMWVAVRANLRAVLELVPTLADLQVGVTARPTVRGARRRRRRLAGLMSVALIAPLAVRGPMTTGLRGQAAAVAMTTWALAAPQTSPGSARFGSRSANEAGDRS